MEEEADHIGLFLMASARYDPRVATKVYRKTKYLDGSSFLSTHSSGEKRAKLLEKTETMEKAFFVYSNAVARHDSVYCFL